MEIELPDGTILDAPDGSDPKKVVFGYKKELLKRKNPAEYGTTDTSEAFSEKYGPVSSGLTGLREGIGSGMTRANRGISKMANDVLNSHPLVKLFGGIDLPGKDFYDSKAIEDQDERDSPLSRTTRGALGQGVGQTAFAAGVTAPLGGLGALGRGGGVLTRTLAHPTTRAALEGAVGGTAAANPDEQGTGAGAGATASAIIERFLKGGGRAIRGLVNKSEAVQDLESSIGKVDIPLAQAASDEDAISRGIRAIYQEGLPNVLGVKGRISRQSRQAMREAMGRSNTDLDDALIEEIFQEPATRGSRTAKILTSLGLGGTLVYGDPIHPLLVLLGGNAMATKTAQKALMGDTQAQKTLSTIIAKHPDMANSVKRLLQSAGATQSGGS